MTDYSAMSGAELLEAYNKVSTTKRKAKFASTEAAIKAIERAEAEAGKSAPAANGKGKAKKAATKKGGKKTGGEGATRTSKRATMKIKFKVKENPHKPGSKGHVFFEEMKASPVYGDYIANSSDPKRAREWFGYSLRVGHVELVA